MRHFPGTRHIIITSHHNENPSTQGGKEWLSAHFHSYFVDFLLQHACNSIRHIQKIVYDHLLGKKVEELPKIKYNTRKGAKTVEHWSGMGICGNSAMCAHILNTVV